MVWPVLLHTPFPASMSSIQIGLSFISQHYQMLKQWPDVAHQIYKDASIMVQVDGNYNKNATRMMFQSIQQISLTPFPHISFSFLKFLPKYGNVDTNFC